LLYLTPLVLTATKDSSELLWDVNSSLEHQKLSLNLPALGSPRSISCFPQALSSSQTWLVRLEERLRLIPHDTRGLNSFPIAAVTNYHKFSSSQQPKLMMLLQFWKSESKVHLSALKSWCW
jgi:hypothetical protein